MGAVGGRNLSNRGTPPGVVQPGWSGGPTPYLPTRAWDGRLVAGAALVFTGFLLQGIGWLLSSLSPFGGFFLTFSLVAVGNIVAAVGFLLAFLGLARPRNRGGP